jgi:predicted DNA-binding transcriptional regulator AlpA
MDTNHSPPDVSIVRNNEKTHYAVADLLDETELAERLGVSRSTLQSWRYTGRGPRYLKLGRLIRYRNVDVDAFLCAGERGSAGRT